MSTIVTGKADVSQELMKALGINTKDVVKVVLIIEVSRVVAVEVTSFVDECYLKGLSDCITDKYELVKKEPE